MNISKMALRMLTVFAYTLPLIFCVTTCGNDGNLRFAFNKTDAIANEEDYKKFNFLMIDSAFAGVVKDSSDEKVSEVINSFKSNPIFGEKILNLKKDAWYRIKWPTDASLSALGMFEMKVLFDNAATNTFALIVLALSLLLSVFSLLLWRIITKWKMNRYILAINLVLILSFIIYCLLHNITVLYGGWLLFFLLLMQLLSEIQVKGKKSEQVVIPSPSDTAEVPITDPH